MLTLALDTATAAVSVAVVEAEAETGLRVLASRAGIEARRHAELLAPALAEVLAEAGVPPGRIDRIVVGVGPGPFTGLRVGLVSAHALSDAWSVPLVGVCSLDALAHRALLEGSGPDVLVLTDARRREVYLAAYRGGVRVAGPSVRAPAGLLAELGWSGRVVGEGARRYPEQFPLAGPPWLPEAGDLVGALHAGAVSLPARPLYLRRPDAAVPGEAKAVLR